MLKSINELRRILMRRVTKKIGNSQVDRNIDLAVKFEVNRVLICRPNHRLGNLLLITPLLQEVMSTFPHCKIDLFVKGNLAQVLFRNYENIDEIIQLPKEPFKHLLRYIQGWISIKKNRYDIVINAVKNSSSGRLSVQFANSKYKVFGDDEVDVRLKYRDYEHSAKYPVYAFRNYLTKHGLVENDRPVPSINLKLSASEIAAGQEELRKLVNNEKKTICLFTYATGDKCYSESWWTNFYERLKVEYPNHNIIEVLPFENVSKISFQAPTFFSKDIRQIGSLIANIEVFIGADSGIMHLASSVQTPTVGLFKVTYPNAYRPYNNNSVGLDTNISNANECVEALNGILIKTDLPELMNSCRYAFFTIN
jgi:ADP-heptose:LPS heptosyltransferase